MIRDIVTASDSSRSELLVDIFAIMDEWTIKDNKIFTLSVMGYTQKEIADKMEVTQQAVSKRIQHLSNCLKIRLCI